MLMQSPPHARPRDYFDPDNVDPSTKSALCAWIAFSSQARRTIKIVEN
ncbi:hypothetical protein CES85_3771 (plasmid) [Ochrobactrum quorumnocens]|uniref:Uncharacterized protein n=1 Tax=Ochrobactrum quorumnocens TaxID=271865 RepID=A0A248UML4_9HYPH|nr:hypothetical protein CES85_3771 [[Ochrobactrum] quorumnocens]